MIPCSPSPVTYHPSPKKAGIFDPYLDTLGGGERYAMTVAEALLKKEWRVDVFWSENKIKERLIDKFDLDINRVNFVSYSPWKNNLFKRFIIERSYDFLFYFSDGSIPSMFSKKNVLHFQVPFMKVKATVKNKVKLRTIDRIVCNSLFTKEVIDKNLGIDSEVVYPPVDIKSIKPLKKENIILSVGRFSQLLQGKRQDVLIEVFRKMSAAGSLPGWRLILAGGSEVGGKEYSEKIRKMAKGSPIEIIENPNFNDLVKLYGEAKIFWTASGYGINEEDEPEKVEHFGITTVEAMAAGCVPVVMNKGGQKESVEDGKNGFLWVEKNELSRITLDLINDKNRLTWVSKNAVTRSSRFSKDIFYQKISYLV